MFAATSPPERYLPQSWHKVLDLFILTLLFCALVAAILALANPSLAGFARWLLITECIGIAAVSCGTLLGRIPWLQRHRPFVAHLYISALAIPVGYMVGSTLAYRLLDEAAPFFEQGPRRIIALVATALGTVFVVYLDSMRRRFSEEAAAREHAQRLAAESQLRLLRAQLEPHMLFNTLANLRTLLEADPRLAQSMIDQLIIYLRSALAASRTESTTLSVEFAQIRAYLQIMALRMGPRLTFRVDLPEELQRVTIPAMLLQPLVENAIKHGLEPKIGSGSIDVHARAVNGHVEIAVTDSGLGVPATASDVIETRPANSSSYGLVHVRERLRAFYGARAALVLLPNQPHGVRAVVRIPQ